MARRDVAAIEVEAPPEFAKAAIPLAWLAQDDTFNKYSLGPGDEMMALGFPRGLSANPAGFPILRSGGWPRIRWRPASVFPTFLMDFSVFPGNSGGPVFMAQGARRRPGSTESQEVQFVAGMLTQQVELSGERLEIGIVTHAKYIRETIGHARQDGRAPLIQAKRQARQGRAGTRRRPRPPPRCRPRPWRRTVESRHRNLRSSPPVSRGSSNPATGASHEHQSS
jgi:hypothetical protein